MIIIDRTSILDLDAIIPTSNIQIEGEENPNFVSVAEKLIDKIKTELEIDIDSMDSNAKLNLAAFSSTKLTDFMTVFILETFFMQKKGRVEWQEAVLTEMKSFLPSLRTSVKDPHLRASVVSFSLYIDLLSQRNLDAEKCLSYLNLIEQEIKPLKKRSKAGNYLKRQLLANKAVLLIHQDKCTEAKKMLKIMEEIGQPRLEKELLPAKMAIFSKNKNYKEFENTVAALQKPTNTVDTEKQTCLAYLFEMGFYLSLNNQKKYCRVFEDFLTKFFLPQSKLAAEQRFLGAGAFHTLARSIAFYVLKNNQLLRALKDQVVYLAEFVEEKRTLIAIAEGFLQKGDFEVAEKMYLNLKSQSPGDEVVNSRLNYIYSLTKPEEIDIETLPQFDLQLDFHSLSKLEAEYLTVLQRHRDAQLLTRQRDKKTQARIDKKTKYGGEAVKATGAEDRQQLRRERRRIKKRNRIRWPKNFNFENPGPRPDPERWLPKYERAKYRKLAIKRGKLTRNQGATGLKNLDAYANKQTFRNENSTANKNVKKRKKKRGRK